MRVIVPVLMMLVMCAFGSNAQATEAALAPVAEEATLPPAPYIAVVDIQALLNQSDAGKGIVAQLEKHRTSFQDKLAEVEAELKVQEQEIITAKRSGDESEFKAELGDFQKKLEEQRRTVAKKIETLNTSYQRAMSELRDEIFDITASIAEERGYNMVISRQDVVIVGKDYDITSEVMTRLNENKKSIKIKLTE